MLQLRSIVEVADNTGVKRASFIGVLGRKDTRFGEVGDIIRVNVKEIASDSTIKKGDVAKAVIVRSKQPIIRDDGSILRFDHNAIVFIDEELNPRGTRVFGPVARELRDKQFTKIISLAPEVL